MKTRKNKIGIITIIILVIIWIVLGIIVHGRNSVVLSGTGKVTKMEQKGEEYFVTVLAGKTEETFEGKELYESVKVYDEVNIVILERRIFKFVYKSEMYLTA